MKNDLQRRTLYSILAHMRTTIEIDDGKLTAAQKLHRHLNQTQLIDLALSELIRIEKNRELAKLAGKFPDLSDVPRRKAV